MTTNKNFKSKKVSNQYSRYFDLKKIYPRGKTVYKNEDFGKDHLQRSTAMPKKNMRKDLSKSGIRSTTVKFQKFRQCRRNENLNPFDGKGSPYLLVSENDTQDDVSKKSAVARTPVCYNVLHDQKPQLEFTDFGSLLRGIRISICIEHTRFPLIAKISKTMGLTHVPEHRLWNIQWCDNTPHFDLLKSMKRFQQINHFPGMSEICRKDLLSRNLNRMLKMYPGDYRIFPKTWLMPTDAYDVASYASKHKRTYILKPYSSGQGRGIWLTNNLRNVGRQEKLICQTYIERPLLIDGFKFDLRVYTLVTSVDPLRIFVYNEGLARFATHKYMPPALGNSNNVFMHLTNYCLNRRNSNYNAGSGNEGGSKRKLSAYNKWLEEHNYSVEEFWATVDDAIIKTVISAWPVLKHHYHLCFPKHDKIQACFQLLGFDILVDWKLKPYILEVNHTPSLAADEIVDNEVKRPLIRDTLNLISSPLVDKEEIIREDRELLRDRLMRQSGRRRVATTGKSTSLANKSAGVGESNPSSCFPCALAQQIAWEESHLGNYRRIMPPSDQDKTAYYCKFYDQVTPVAMFKETTTSKSRMKLNQTFVEQQRVADKVNAEKLQQRPPKTRGDKLVIVDFQPSSLQMQREKAMETLIIKNIQRQKQKLTQLTAFKETAAVWKAVNNTHAHHGRFSLKTKRSFTVLKTQRRKQRRQMHRKLRRARRLEWEARQDDEFLQRHSLTLPVVERLPGGSSAQPASASSKRGQHSGIIKSLKGKSAANQKSVTKVKAKSETHSDSSGHNNNNINKVKTKPTMLKPNNAKCGKTKKRSTDWLPAPIDDKENQGQMAWRQERSTVLKDWQFKELLFAEMFERGNLTKNDIKLFPNILYRLLKGKASKVAEGALQ